MCWRHFTVTIILLWQCISNGAAIKCFICDSSVNPGCADLKSNSSIVPEECTLNKTKSMETWLFELNRFAYFETDKAPVMNCQKVVAKDPNTNRMVTARFCQLNTADSDACVILRNKLGVTEEEYTYPSSGDGKQNGGGGGGSGGGGADDSAADKFHCSICMTDHCNGAAALRLTPLATLMAPLLLLLLPLAIMQMPLQERVW